MGYWHICVDCLVLGVDTILKQNMSQFVRMPKFNNKVNPGIFDTETVAKIPAAQLFDDVTRSEGMLSIPQCKMAKNIVDLHVLWLHVPVCQRVFIHCVFVVFS